MGHEFSQQKHYPEIHFIAKTLVMPEWIGRPSVDEC